MNDAAICEIIARKREGKETDHDKLVMLGMSDSEASIVDMACQRSGLNSELIGQVLMDIRNQDSIRRAKALLEDFPVQVIKEKQ